MSALRKWTTSRSPTSAYSVGPGMFTPPLGAANPSVISWYTYARKDVLPPILLPCQSSRPVGTMFQPTVRAWIQYSRRTPPGAGSGVGNPGGGDRRALHARGGRVRLGGGAGLAEVHLLAADGAQKRGARTQLEERSA